ncbi:hypothetical protein PHLCEN_2v4401 [Hermanssonia centrifuga]|uniref:FAD linked oxidase N-terminal domain-containing protein n=1 Tax=Hermanssonia centrifuga TaxID=98765 RepID=A0A2R6PNQ7_9APHY|nr:hypothetical protein PHLCEN_2v4401 [Hermanssonia centrifuga]
MRYGGFQLLFNAADPLGERVPGLDVPNDFEPTVIGIGPVISRLRRNGVLKSAHIKETQIEASVSAENVPIFPTSAKAKLEYSFESSVSEGALLATKYETRCVDAQQLGTFRKYILAHYKSWFQFANCPDHDHGIDVEDLLFVTGCDMTADFSMLAFKHNKEGQQVRFELGAASIASASASWGTWQCQSPLTYENWGPQTLEDDAGVPLDGQKYDQCIFLRAFGVARRAWILPKVIKANAGPHDPGLGERRGDQPPLLRANIQDSGDLVDSVTRLEVVSPTLALPCPGSPPTVVVYPTSTEDVVHIVHIAKKYRMPVVPYSGATSLEGHWRAVSPSPFSPSPFSPSASPPSAPYV